jgi:hypothetical protein
VAAAWSDWTRLQPTEDRALFDGAGHILNDVAAAGSLIVAVGDAAGSEANGMRDGLVVISADGGTTWERVSDPEDLDVGGKGLNAVIAAGPGFIAGGGSCDTEERGPFHPALWWSSDGRDWVRVPHDPDSFGDRGGIYYLLARDADILAMGAVCSGELCGGAMWRSADGTEWERIWGIDPDFWGGSLVVTDAGLLVVEPPVWTSIDGTEWSAVPLEPDPFAHDDPELGWSVMDVTLGASGYVAVGSDGNDAAVWTSIDGTSWERIPHDPDVFADASMMDVLAFGEGYLAIGPDWAITEEIGGPVPGMPSVPTPPVLWVSPGGRTWHRIELGGDPAAVRSMIEFDGSLIAVGQSGTFIDGADAIWINDQPPALGGGERVTTR